MDRTSRRREECLRPILATTRIPRPRCTADAPAPLQVIAETSGRTVSEQRECVGDRAGQSSNRYQLSQKASDVGGAFFNEHSELAVQPAAGLLSRFPSGDRRPGSCGRPGLRSLSLPGAHRARCSRRRPLRQRLRSPHDHRRLAEPAVLQRRIHGGSSCFQRYRMHWNTTTCATTTADRSPWASAGLNRRQLLTEARAWWPGMLGRIA